VGVKWWLLSKGFTLPLAPSRQGRGDSMHKTGLSKCHSVQRAVVSNIRGNSSLTLSFIKS
jgi:hypothetical protein